MVVETGHHAGRQTDLYRRLERRDRSLGRQYLRPKLGRTPSGNPSPDRRPHRGRIAEGNRGRSRNRPPQPPRQAFETAQKALTDAKASRLQKATATESTATGKRISELTKLQAETNLQLDSCQTTRSASMRCNKLGLNIREEKLARPSPKRRDRDAATTRKRIAKTDDRSEEHLRSCARHWRRLRRKLAGPGQERLRSDQSRGKPRGRKPETAG